MVCIISLANGQNRVSKICEAVSGNLVAAKDKLLNVLHQEINGKNFPLSIKYIIGNSNNLSAGKSSCEEFINGLIIEFQADLENNGGLTVTIENAQQILAELIKSKLKD